MARRPNSQKATFVYEETKTLLLRYIVDQGLSNGALLPSMQELGNQLCDGRLKPVRMAVQHLVAEGVLESHRGRGVFVCDAGKATTLFSEEATSSSVVEAFPDDADVTPFSFGTSRPTLRFAVGNGAPVLMRVWKDIVARFNASSPRIRVKVEVYDPRAGTDQETFNADVIQLQAHIRRMLPVSFRFLDLREWLGRRTLNRFVDSLYPVPGEGGEVFGLPITVVTHSLMVNEHVSKEGWPLAPVAWEGFDAYADFILAVREQEPSRVTGVVYGNHNLLFHLALAGLTTGNTMAGLPCFESDPVRDFLTRFARVYCRPDCYVGRWLGRDIDRRRDVPLYESHTYQYDFFSSSAPCKARDFVAPPTEGGGRVPVIPHLVGVNADSKVKEDAIAFVDYLASDEIMQTFLDVGHISGRRDAQLRLHPALWQSLEHGAVLEDACPELLNLFAEKADPEVWKWQRGELTVDALCETLEKERLAGLAVGQNR